MTCVTCQLVPAVAKGECWACYQYRRRNGTSRTNSPRARIYQTFIRKEEERIANAFDKEARLLRRFMARVDKTPGCWNWTGGKQTRGYGVFSLDGKQRPAHRVAYTLFVGKIRPNHVIDHLCNNRSCVNPDHLEMVTQAENVQRAKRGA